MIKKYTHKTITWVDVENPTQEEIRTLMEDYGVEHSTAKELQLPSFKDRIYIRKNYMYIVLHFPALRHSHGEEVSQEIDFVVGKNFIITTRYGTVDALENFTKQFEVNNILDKGIMEDHAGFVLYYIMKELYRTISDELDTINDSLREVEKKTFNGREKEMVIEISKINRDLLHLKHTINSHKDIVTPLEEMGKRFFGEDFSDNLDKMLNEYYKTQQTLDNSIDFLKELRETNDSLLNTKQNEIMKTLTILTFLAIPFSVITGFFQMNTAHTPLLGINHDWQLIVGVEIAITIVLFIIARLKKWL
jgi:magnesium transporter